MNQNKQNWIEEHTFSILFIITIVVILFYFFYTNTTNYLCSNNPDKCVIKNQEDLTKCIFTRHLELAETKEDAKNNCIEYNPKLFSLRKKTQAEMDIDDCNSNPREDNRCNCIEEGDSEKIISSYSCPNSCQDVTTKKCKVNGLYNYNQKIEIEGYILYDNICEFKSPIGEITHVRNLSFEVVEENVIICNQCYNYEQVCIKSQPRIKQE